MPLAQSLIFPATEESPLLTAFHIFVPISPIPSIIAFGRFLPDSTNLSLYPFNLDIIIVNAVPTKSLILSHASPHISRNRSPNFSHTLLKSFVSPVNIAFIVRNAAANMSFMVSQIALINVFIASKIGLTNVSYIDLISDQVFLNISTIFGILSRNFANNNAGMGYIGPKIGAKAIATAPIPITHFLTDVGNAKK